MRINAGARAHGLSYNQFISGLKAADVELDRKVLADLAVSDPAAFGKLAEQAKAALRRRRPDPRPSGRRLFRRQADYCDTRSPTMRRLPGLARGPHCGSRRPPVGLPAAARRASSAWRRGLVGRDRAGGRLLGAAEQPGRRTRSAVPGAVDVVPRTVDRKARHCSSSRARASADADRYSRAVRDRAPPRHRHASRRRHDRRGRAPARGVRLADQAERSSGCAAIAIVREDPPELIAATTSSSPTSSARTRS